MREHNIISITGKAYYMAQHPIECKLYKIALMPLEVRTTYDDEQGGYTVESYHNTFALKGT